MHNAEVLECIDKCMFVLSLDDYKPRDSDDLSKRMLVGDGSNRWFDKCFTSAGFDGPWHGVNVEHTAIDAMVRTFIN